MKKGKTKQIASIFIVLALSFGAIQALSTPVFGTIAVRMSNDKTINTSIAVLESNLENLKIVDYNTLEFAIEISRIVGPVIWVGHGDADGIETADTSISWDDFSRNIKRTAASDYVLSCYSSNLIEKTTLDHDDALTFAGEIDSTLGALIVSYYCNPSISIAEKAISHISSLQNKRVTYTPLLILLDPGDGGGGTPPPPTSVVWANPNIPGAGFTTGEMILHGLIILILIISLFAITAGTMIGTSSIFASAFLTALATAGNFVATLMIVITDFCNGDSSILDFIGDLIGILVTLIDVVIIFKSCLDIIYGIFGFLLFMTALTTESAAKVACPPVWAVTLGITIVATLAEIGNAINDWKD